LATVLVVFAAYRIRGAGNLSLVNPTDADLVGAARAGIAEVKRHVPRQKGLRAEAVFL